MEQKNNSACCRVGRLLLQSARWAAIFLGGSLLVLTLWNLGMMGYHQAWASFARMRSGPLTCFYTPSKKAEIGDLFHQDFFYIGEGVTSNVFVSSDGRHVLKTMRKRSYLSKSHRWIPGLNRLGNKRKEMLIKYGFAASCLRSYRLLPDETGLVYYHVHPTSCFNRSVTLHWGDGTTTLFDLDQNLFYLQKKAIVVEDYFKDCFQTGQMEKAKRAITKLFEFVWMAGCQDCRIFDIKFYKNFGFIDDQVVRIDIERIKLRPGFHKKVHLYLKGSLRNFRNWLEQAGGEELLPFFDAEVERMGLLRQETFTLKRHEIFAQEIGPDRSEINSG